MKKRILPLCLTLALLCCLCPPVFAAETEETTESATAPSTEAVTEPSTEPATTPPAETTTPTESTAPSETTDATDPTEDTTPTEPSMATDPTAPPEPSEPTVPQLPTVLEIDSSHVYSGMDMAYEDGNLPRMFDGVMEIVLPLKCSGALWDDQLDASLSLDTSASSPFVVENFRKTFYLETVTPENSDLPQEIYLVAFDILLSESRKNGTYPVTVNISAFDDSGGPVSTAFTLYITITDGKIEKIAQPVVDTPTAEPVVYISNTKI